MASSLFSSVPLAPRDPILGVTEAFNADTRPTKVNLGVGVYYDENGKLPLLDCVRQAEDQLNATHAPRGYLPIDGIPAYDQAVQKLLLGKDSPVIADKRAITAQALGGTGGLKIGADLLRRFSPEGTTVYISDPSWENHRAIFEAAGFKVETYPYYDAATHGVNFQGMLDCIKAARPGSVFVLHACCHNPTGVDLDGAQWDQVLAALQSAGQVPFLDIAYQGFGDGIEEDGAVVRKFATSSITFLVSSSFSKSFSLYGERVGALTVVLPNVLAPVLVIGTISLALAIVAESTLSYLGVGLPPTQPSLGTLIRIGQGFLFSGEWWILLFPSLMLLALALPVLRGFQWGS